MGGMCGRYASIKAPADLAEEFRAVDATGGAAQVDYNVAPTKQVIAVVERHPRDEDGTPDPDVTQRSLRMVRWGLVPSWSKDPKAGARMINARAESAREKPAFRKALAARRCLIPADGWYEWQRGANEKSAGHKQPYYTHYRDGSSVALAGLWEFWRPAGGAADRDYPDGLVTCAVLTTEAVGPLAQVHDRMPLVLPPTAWETWLDPDTDASADAVAALLAPPAPELVSRLELRPVSPRVNNVRNNGPELIEPLPPEDVAEPLQLDLLAGPNPQ
jgi:putative SOS response-associated peptidase YedK